MATSNLRKITADAIQGVQATKNYISNGNFENNTVTNWSLFNTTLTSGVPTGTITSGAASLTLNPTSSNVLFDGYSMQIVAGSAWTAGQGFISDAFTVDRGDLGKVLTFKFYYQAVSGGLNANWSGILGSQSLSIYIYDATVGAWIQPTGFLGMNQNSGAGYVTGTFQSSVTVGQQYRIAILGLQTTSGAITVNFDNFVLNSQTSPVGSAMTDWQDRGTITIGAATTAPTKGTTATDKVRVRRVGDSAQLMYEYQQTSSGTTGTGTYLISLPSGMSFDTSKITVASSSSITTRSTATAIGTGVIGSTTATGYNGNIIFYALNATQFLGVFTSSQASNGTSDSSVDEPWGSSAYPLSDSSVSFKAMITAPIAGWGSFSQMSSDTDTRVVALSASVTTTQSIPTGSNTQVIFGSYTDTHGTYNSSTGAYTIPVSGWYNIYGNIHFSAAAWAAGNDPQALLITDGSVTRYLYAQNVTSAGTWEVTLPYSISGFYRAGQTVAILAFQNSVGARNLDSISTFNVNRLSGPSVITATETVAESYYLSVNQSVTANVTTINFDTKEFSTHNSVTTGASWKWVVPVSGTYQINITQNNVAGASSFGLYKSNVLYRFVSNANTFGFGASIIKLNAGEEISFRSNTTQTLNGGTVFSGATQVQIVRVGN